MTTGRTRLGRVPYPPDVGPIAKYLYKLITRKWKVQL